MDLASVQWTAVAACFAFSVVSGAICAALLVPLIANAMGGLTITSGMTAGAFIWLGFVGSSGLANKLFAGYLKAWMIESGNHLLNYVVFGAIIGALV